MFCLSLTNMKHFHTAITLSALALPQQKTMNVKGVSNPIIYHAFLGRRRRHAFQNPWGLPTTPKHQHRHKGLFSWRHQRIDQCPWCHQSSTDENTQPSTGRLSLVQKKVPKEKINRARRLALGGMKVSEDAVAESGSWGDIALPELQDGVSMVTSIQVDNLAMVDSVKVKVSNGGPCRWNGGDGDHQRPDLEYRVGPTAFMIDLDDDCTSVELVCVSHFIPPCDNGCQRN